MPKHAEAKRVVAFYAIAFGVNWIIDGAIIASGGFTTVWHILAYGIGWMSPAIAAAIMVRKESGPPALRSFLGQVARWRISRWYVVGFLVPTLCLLAGNAMDATMRNASPTISLHWAPTLGIVGPPLVEEYGWRGYALPRLQRVTGFLPAAVMVSVLWALWHLPIYFFPGASLASFLPVALILVADGVLIAWLYNQSAGLLTVAMVAHAGLNLGIVPIDWNNLRGFYLGVLTLAALGVGLTLWTSRKQSVTFDT